MGSRRDWWNLPPEVVQAIELATASILCAGGVDPKMIDAAIWSNYHWDHVGNIQQFPSSTDIVAGYGFKNSFLPGYPTISNSPFFITSMDVLSTKLHSIAAAPYGLDSCKLMIISVIKASTFSKPLAIPLAIFLAWSEPCQIPSSFWVGISFTFQGHIGRLDKSQYWR